MNVSCYQQNNLIYICEVTNDLEKINKILDSHALINELNIIYDIMWINYTEEKWNNYVSLMIYMLEESGCEIVWI